MEHGTGPFELVGLRKIWNFDDGCRNSRIQNRIWIWIWIKLVSNFDIDDLRLWKNFLCPFTGRSIPKVDQLIIEILSIDQLTTHKRTNLGIDIYDRMKN
ncbi:hypothetical protein BLOT_010457 [Blomia tropicalis]|nr:hypothetical protein BLOT_010457 [Blomia tropicalis]